MNHCHSNKLYHGFLRPGNILTEKKSNFEDMRIINFPLSLGYEHNTHLNEKFQFPYFMAPELFEDKHAGQAADCWSCGAIIYFLLSGQVPFPGETDVEIEANIRAGKLNLSEGVWPSVSDHAKDLISKLLTVDPKQRISVKQALGHAWILEAPTIEQKENTDADNEAMDNIKIFNMERKLIRGIYAFIAMELFLKDEAELYGPKGEVTKEEAFKLHRECCGQSL